MTRRTRITLTTLVLVFVSVIVVGIGWADTFFLKTGVISGASGIIMKGILWPVFLLPIVPGSSLDTPLFFVPAIVLNLIVWAIAIQILWEKTKGRPNKAL